MTFALIVSCKKDKEVISDHSNVDSSASIISDSLQNPTIQNPDQPVAFELAPQNINSQKGRTLFTQNGKVLFYFDQNSNTGNVRIDGKDYPLNQFEFSENNYSISGNQVKIEASNGDFGDETSDCVQGNFPEISISVLNEKVNFSNVTVQDCPNY